MGARRGGRHRRRGSPSAELTVVGKPRRAQTRAAAGLRRRRATRSTSRCPACSTPPCCARPSPAAASTALQIDAALAVPGVRAVLGPEDELSFASAPARCTASPTTPAPRSPSVAADTLAAAKAGVRALALEIDPLPFVVDMRGRLPRPAHRRRSVRGHARRRRRRAGRRRRLGRAPGRDARAAADADRAARRGRLVEAGRADLLDRDAGHLRRPRRADAGASTCRRSASA